MTFRREKDLQEKVREAIIKLYGPNIWYYHPSDRNRNGVPDIIMTFYGMFVAIELKNNLKAYDATKMQKFNLEKIKSAGGFILISDDFDEVINFLESLIKP